MGSAERRKAGHFAAVYDGTPDDSLSTITSITVNLMGSIPNGLASRTDTFDVGSQTIVLGNSGSAPFGSLGSVATGDVVAGGLIAPGGATASTVESTPPQVPVDFPQSSSSSTSSASAQKAASGRAERRALDLLRYEKAKHEHHNKQ